MDARAETGSIPAFRMIGTHLRGLGLCAPQVLFERDGLLLLEDLGPMHMAAWLAQRPDEAPSLYAAAVDVLVRLQSAPPPVGPAVLTPLRAAGMIAPLFEHYAPETDPRLAADLTGRLMDALEAWATEASVLALRDYHAENLIWRSDRDGTDRVGLLDFQDAVVAAPEYDLASLLRDARRDTDSTLRAAMIRRFAERTGRSEAVVASAAAILGIQRNLRILGVFTKLAREKGKRGYLALMPRVWAHIEGDLLHPAAARLASAVHAAVPSPDRSL